MTTPTATGKEKLRDGAGGGRRGPPDEFDAAEEAVALLGQRLDESRRTHIVTEHGTDATDTLVDALLEIDPGTVGPQVIANLFARDDLTGSTDQQPEQPRRLRRQANQHPGLA